MRVRPWVLADAASLEPACGDPDICRFTTVPQTYTTRAAKDWITRQHTRIADGGAVVLAIEPASTAEPVGMVGVFGLDEAGSAARFGYWLVREYRRCGLASEAVRLLAAWAFDHLAVDALHIDVEPKNEPSQRVAQAVGATRERQLTRHMAGQDVVLDRFTMTRHSS